MAGSYFLPNLETYTPYGGGGSSITNLAGPGMGVNSLSAASPYFKQGSSPWSTPATASNTSRISYNANPAPQGGRGAYGAVPGPTGVPPSVYEQTSNVIPGLSNLTGAAGQNVLNELSGVISPTTIKSIQDHAAAFGVSSGMPGSQFAGYQGLRNLGIASEEMRAQGVKDYLSLLTGVGSTQNRPELLAEIASENAVRAAAPDPYQAAMQLQKDYMDKMKFGFEMAGGGKSFFSPPNLGFRKGNPYNIESPGSTAVLTAINPVEPYVGKEFPYAMKEYPPMEKEYAYPSYDNLIQNNPYLNPDPATGAVPFGMDNLYPYGLS